MNITQQKINYMLIPGTLRYEVEPFHLVERISMISGVKMIELMAKHKDRDSLDVKYMTWYLLKEHHKLTFEQIGDMFGKNHATILQGIKQFKALKETNTDFRNKYNYIFFELAIRLGHIKK